MNYETYYTASICYDGDAGNPWNVPAGDITTRAGLIRRVKTMFNISGVKCRVIDGVGPDGLSYTILYPKLSGYEIAGKTVSILIEERLTEDAFIG
jgi:hypothetical protein